MPNTMTAQPVCTAAEWSFDTIERITEEIERIAQEELQLDYYPYRLEIISSEQMMDAYTSVGMPINYHHWSFGKQFIILQEHYKRGHMGLAYEIVINSNPCIAYLMEENSMTMQALVIAHAAFGHNAFMKNNYLFTQWTHADAIIDYLAFARNYLAQCEERYGVEEVEAVLDACHALQTYGVDRYTHPAALSVAKEARRQQERWDQAEREVNVLWSTLPKRATDAASVAAESDHHFEPQENILYFIEKKAPELPQWKREIVRIVRKIAQYFYPQRQTKVLNEGFATFVHYYIMNRLSAKGLITAGAMQEFLHTHTNVVMQPDFGPINPYALGFQLFMDVKRICNTPTAEDRAWFPEIAGSPWLETIKYMAASFQDESAILQFLSPCLMRHFRLFAVHDDDRKPALEVTAIHNNEGYRHVRKILAEQHHVGRQDPIIEVSRVDRFGDRHLTLRHRLVNRRQLVADDAKKVLHYTSQLWGFPVEMEIEENGAVRPAWRVAHGELRTELQEGEE